MDCISFYLYIWRNKKIIMETIELNENNCKEYTTEELLSKLDSLMSNETTIAEDIKELHNSEKEGSKLTWKIDGVITEEFKNHSKKHLELRKSFQSKWGKDCLVTFNMYKTLKKRLEFVPKGNAKLSTTRLQNSKGNKFGNL